MIHIGGYRRRMRWQSHFPQSKGVTCVLKERMDGDRIQFYLLDSFTVCFLAYTSTTTLCNMFSFFSASSCNNNSLRLWRVSYMPHTIPSSLHKFKLQKHPWIGPLTIPLFRSGNWSTDRWSHSIEVRQLGCDECILDLGYPVPEPMNQNVSSVRVGPFCLFVLG